VTLLQAAGPCPSQGPIHVNMHRRPRPLPSAGPDSAVIAADRGRPAGSCPPFGARGAALHARDAPDAGVHHLKDIDHEGDEPGRCAPAPRLCCSTGDLRVALPMGPGLPAQNAARRTCETHGRPLRQR